MKTARTGGRTSQSEVTAYEYDPAGRLIKETDALGNQTVYRYDGAGQLATASVKLETGIRQVVK